ncbi:integrin beta-nu isoform X2 [Episyrphus balteatus]|uniref:integrin beta-nu isoform X2 n=1 Tax=Episyrphus balteatus TaxID=286459 RepID=UPI0024851A7F|nr:integrin beta-nu isoform X2 [Episyrphus balteatus]
MQIFEIKSTNLNGDRQCYVHDTCEGCLGENFYCAWCTDKTHKMPYRCLTYSELVNNNCSPDNIWVNKQGIDIISADELRDFQSDSNRATQVKPQKIHIKLVKSHTQQFKLTYRPALNNPLDLYYLMDLTWTMRDDRKTLVRLGAKLSEALKNLTANHRIGFGSFADKPTMPMIMPHLIDNPCAAEGHSCEPTYSFRHHLPLTDDIDKFVKSVKRSRVTGNLDNLEGGIDALMQVIVCTERIGWKKEARKIVVFATDGFMHFAGDGILAGASIKNDRKCHLDESGEYTESLFFDYPSLEETYRELVKQKISVVYAVTGNVYQTYQEMDHLMNGTSNVEKLSMDSSNILELIKTSYETFLKRVKFTDNSPPFIHLNYETNCGNQFENLRQRNYCNDLKMGKEVEFYINITLKAFPTDGMYHRTILIEDPGLSEHLELDVEIQEACPCDEKGAVEENERAMCNEHGIFHCGRCKCDDGWGGVFCECNLSNTNSTFTIQEECRQPFKNPAQLGPICSERGECDCGKCYCFPGYSGKYCECPECIDCDLEKADCFCGKCVCKYGWSGNRCNCEAEVDDSCKTPNGEICSERGECQCGECLCKAPFVGRFCEIGWENENKLCQYYEPCVKCLIQQKLGSRFCENISDICSNTDKINFQYSFVTEINGEEGRCVVRLINHNDNKCDHLFSYDRPDSSNNFLTIQVTDCKPVNPLVMGGFISLFTFLFGFIVLVIYVCCTRIADAREYAKFEEQKKHSTLMESPLYESPIRKYLVPQLEDDNMTI